MLSKGDHMPVVDIKSALIEHKRLLGVRWEIYSYEIHTCTQKIAKCLLVCLFNLCISIEYLSSYSTFHQILIVFK